MKFQKSSIAMAVLALCGATSFSAQAAPTVSFSAPAAGAALSGVISDSSLCEVTGTGISRVKFYVDAEEVNSDNTAPFRCSFDTNRYSKSTHTLKAIAIASDGTTATATRTVTFGTAPSQPANQAPNVTLTAPTNTNASGTVSYAATASDDKAVARVEFKLGTQVLANDTSAPYGGSLNTTTLANGVHVLTATAYDAEGLSRSSMLTLNVQNSTTTPPPPVPPSGGTSTPAPGAGALDVWFKAPLAGATVSGLLNGGTGCYVNGTGVTKVEFSLDGTALNTDSTMGDGMQCAIDTTKFANGTRTLTAKAFSSTGATRSDVISINVQNTVTPPPTGGNQAPTVSFTAPAAGSTVKGTISYAATAKDDVKVTKVEFRAGDKLLKTDTAAPHNGSLNTTTLADGPVTLTATAYDAAGLTTVASLALVVQNKPVTTPPTEPPPTNNPPTSSLPSTNTQAIATFESIGMYWKPGANPGAAGCTIRYKKVSESAWKEGLPMWYDSRNSECRGSLVHLAPGTDYEVQMGTGSTFKAGRVAKTWSEQFPVAKTITIPSGSGAYTTPEGGTPDGYVVYTGGTLDAANGADFNIVVNKPYVIVRGMTLKGARVDAVRLNPGAHDVVIENNEISGWGRARSGNLGVDQDSAVRAICNSSWRMERAIVQNNRIHSPRFTANTWDSGHPAGPQGVTLHECGGNSVIRYNEIYSTNGNHYNDAIGAGENYSTYGSPAFDSDIYGNRITHTYDDGIESEGANRNVRIWGNYIDGTFVGIASTATHTGPLYVFRNIYANGGTFAKSGQNAGFGGGRRYFFHNTVLVGEEGIKGNTGQPLTNAHTRNNVLVMKSAGGMAIGMIGGAENSFDYDLSNGSMTPIAGAETNGFVGAPVWASGAGPSSGANGNYQLAPGSRGFDQAVRIPNFNDSFSGAGPDVGAHEGGTPAMKFGRR